MDLNFHVERRGKNLNVSLREKGVDLNILDYLLRNGYTVSLREKGVDLNSNNNIFGYLHSGLPS